MPRVWIATLFLAFAAGAQAQLSVGSTAALTPGYVGSTYCFVQTGNNAFTCPSGILQIIASGGTPPYSFAVTSGGLPPGMSLQSDNGALNGKPSATGSYPATVTATDSKGAKGSASFTIPVFPVFSGPLVKGTVGVPFVGGLTCALGSFNLTGLPPGITASATGFAGTPTTAGTYTTTLVCPNITLVYPFLISGPFTATPTTLTLNGTAGGPPVKAALQVGTQTAGLAFTVATPAAQPWLTAVGSGPTPATVNVTMNPANLPAGTYNGPVTVTTPGVGPVNIPVKFVVGPAAAAVPKLGATPASLTFSALRTAQPVTKTIVIANTGTGSVGPMNFRFVGGFASNPPEIESHLSVSPSSGTVTPSSPLTLTVTLNPNLTGVIYFASLIGSTAAGDQITIPISAQITSTPKMWWSQNAVYLGAFGDSPGLVRQPVSKTVGLYTDGNITVKTAVFPGSGVIIPSAPWLSVTPTFPFNLTSTGAGITFNVTSQSLLPGDYYGYVQADTTPSSLTSAGITIVFRVIPGNAPGGFFSTNLTNALTFEGSGRTSFAPPLTISLTTIDTTPLPLTLSLEFNEGQAFAAVSPTATSTVAGTPAIITLTQTIDIGSLPASPNIVTGNIVIQRGTGLAPVKVPFALIKRLQNQVNSAPARNADCVPTKLQILRAAPLENFAATVGLPEDINVRTVDDCGGFDTATSVTARFSNGDSPVELQPIGNGSWSGSWSGRTANDSVVMTITALSTNQSLSGSVDVGGSLAANPKQPPFIFDGGVLNGGSFAIGGPLSPGSFVTLFGEKLANSTLKAETVPLANALAGGSVFIGGKLAPVFYASDGQVNAIIPYGLPTGGPLPVMSVRDGIVSAQQSISIVPAAPGIFMYGDRQAIAVGPNGLDLIDATHPVRAGQTIVVYCTGLGEVSPAVAAGTQTPPTTLARTVNAVTATIGGVNAQVDFSGLTPGQTGLYQVNIVVPSGVTAGDRVPIVLQAAGAAGAPAYISVR